MAAGAYLCGEKEGKYTEYLSIGATCIYIALACVFQPYIILRQARENVRNVFMAAHIHTSGTIRPLSAFAFPTPAGTKKNRPDDFSFRRDDFKAFLAGKRAFSPAGSRFRLRRFQSLHRESRCRHCHHFRPL